MYKCNNCLHNKLCVDGANYKAAESCKHYISAADVQEVRHGHWCDKYKSGTPAGDGVVSSCCDMWNERKTAFCPHCGARMEGEENGKN